MCQEAVLAALDHEWRKQGIITWTGGAQVRSFISGKGTYKETACMSCALTRCH